MKELDYYKANETLSNRYYQIPQELFESSLYKDKLNSDSKILYAFLLDRLSLSEKNHWIDKDKRIFLIFTRQEVGEKLGLSEKTVTKAFKQLIDADLIEEKRQGLGKPNLIYVVKITYEEKHSIADTENLQDLNRKNYRSETVESTFQEQENLPTINTNNIKTNIIKTDSIHLNSDEELELTKIKKQCKLNEFTKEEIVVLEDVIDTLYYKSNLKIGNIIANHSKILDKLKLITKDNLIRLLDILKNTPNIKNAKNYLMICLYNNLGNTYSSTEKKNIALEEKIGRDYQDAFLDKFYANFSYEQALAN